MGRLGRATAIAALAVSALAPGAAAAATIVSNTAGDQALVSRFPEESLTARSLASLRPSGGVFGATVPLTPHGASDPSVAIGDSGAAVAAWTQGTAKRQSVHVALREPGAGWGTPITLAKRGVAPRVAIDAQGNALVVWSRHGGSMQSAQRAPGSAFSPPADLPAAGLVSDLQMDAGGNALVLSFPRGDSSTSRLQSSFRPAGGAFEAPRDVASVSSVHPESALAMNPAGDAIVVFAKGRRLVASRRPAGGEFGPPVNVSGKADFTPTVSDVALGGDGSATVTWRVDPGSFFGTMLVFAGFAPPDGPFQSPLALGTYADPATDARVAADERGDTALVWGDPRFRVSAAYRPAGGTLTQPIRLAGPRLGGVPDIAIDAAGHATAAWQQNDGERRDLVARDFSSAGATEPAQVIHTAPAYKQLPNARARCHPPGTRTLVESSEARVYGQNHEYDDPKYGCYFKRGKPVLLNFGFGDFPEVTLPPAMALAGPLVAYVNLDDVCATCGGYDALTVRDLRTGRLANGYAPAGLPDPETFSRGRIRRMVLRRDAALAYIQRKRKTVRVYKMDAGALGPKRLAKSKTIDPRFLRLSDGRVEWRQGGRVRSAPLR